MERDARYKLITYHGTGLGELFDLHTDPAEYDTRRHDPALAAVRHDLLSKASTPSPSSPTLGHTKPPTTDGRC